MENYKKSVIRELETCLPLPAYVQPQNNGGPASAVTISVKTGTKMRNVLSFGFKQLERPEIKHIIWLAEAEAIGKAVGCAEIMKRGQSVPSEDEPAKPTHATKRKSGGGGAEKQDKSKSSPPEKTSPPKRLTLHQTNVLGYRRTEEIWDPVVQGLDKLKVNKDVPILAVILSKEPAQASDISNSAVPVTALQTNQGTDFEAFWQSRINAVLAAAPTSGGSAAIEIKKPQQQQTGVSSGRTPPVSASPLS